jgi:predicted ATPase
VPSPYRSAITGGPGAGKSTLLKEIAATGIATFPEVARSLLQAPNGMAMRADHAEDFAMAMFEAELIAWQSARSGASVYDRGFPDIVGFLELEGFAVPPALDHACRENRYNGPIFRAPPWREIYTVDEERIQDWEGAVASDAAVTAAWTRYGYQLIDLPFTSAKERAVLARQHLGGSFQK